MKKYIIIGLLTLCIVPNMATAITPYFSTGVTTGIQNNGRHASTAYDTLWTITGGIQYALTSNISMRNGIEFAMSDYTFKNDTAGINYEYDAKTKIYLGTAVVAFRPTGFRSSIYAGLSAGVTDYETTLKSPMVAPTETHSTFTYGASAGVSVNLIGNLFGDFGIRYLTTADAGNDGNLITTAALHLGF